MPLAARAGEMLADRNRAGEGDLLHGRRRNEVLRHVGRHAEYQIEHARRQTGVGEAFHQFNGAGRCFLRGLDDERAAGGERAGDLADRRERREIPRRERRHHADRLLQHKLPHTLLAARHDAAVRAAAFLGIPVDDVGRRQHLGARLSVALALLLGLHGGDVLVALAQQLRRLAHDLGAVVSRRRLPNGEALLGSGERGVEIGSRGVRQMPERLAGGRVDHVFALAAFAVEPLSVNEKLELGVHGGLVVTRN